MFSLEIEDQLPEMVGDRERIEQVVVNIISNALKYTPSGGQVRVTVGKEEQDKVFVKVKDNGIGIPQEDIPRLFERFLQGWTKHALVSGAARGLVSRLQKRLSSITKGKLSVESELDHGTTVTITLPTNLPLPE